MNEPHSIEETWLPIPGYQGLYEVSSHGRVMSFGRYIKLVSRAGRPYEYWRDGRILRQAVINRAAWGGKQVTLYNHGGNRRGCFVHRLVLAAFVGPCPDDMECCHYDGDASNNSLENLRYDTKAGNWADRLRHGTDTRGVRHRCVKLSEDNVFEIRRLVGDGYRQIDMARRFGVSASTIGAVIARRSWAWLQDSHENVIPASSRA